MKDKRTWSQIRLWGMSRRVVSCQAACGLVKLKLENSIRPTVGDVGDERKAVRGISLDGVRPVRSVSPFHRRENCCTVISHLVNCRSALVVVCREYEPAAAVGCHIHRLTLQRHVAYM